MITFDWITALLRPKRKREKPTSCEFFVSGDRIVLVPSVIGRDATYADPENAVNVTLAHSDAALGHAIIEALDHCKRDIRFRPPDRNKGDVIDRKTHELVGVKAARSFFARVKYGHIYDWSGRIELHPSRKGALDARLRKFEAAREDPGGLGAGLRAAIEACLLK